MKIAKYGNQYIDLNKMTSHQLKELKSNQNYTCPYCHHPVILKYGEKKRAHFSHLKPCDYKAHDNESEAHKACKSKLVTWLHQQEVPLVLVEYRLPSISRIADIYFEWKGERYVIEIQKSHIAESLFKKRTEDYEQEGVTLIWIFIGALLSNKNSYHLNQVMRYNKRNLMVHFDLPNQRFTFMNQLIWLTQKEVDGSMVKVDLSQLSVSQFLNPSLCAYQFEVKKWLAIKKEFRLKRSLAYQRYEYGLLKLCAPLFINLSMLPSVIGWPVVGSAYTKPLFIWQAYVVLGIMSNYHLNDVFTLSEIQRQLKVKYHLKETTDTSRVLKDYLSILVKFKMLKRENGYYEYISKPRIYTQIETNLLEDERLINKFVD